MTAILSKPLAFLRRDFLTALSYRTSFAIQIVGILISTLTFYFLSRLVGRGMANQLAPYGGDYFAFVLIGVATTDYLTVSLSGFASEIRQAQVLGTLEALLVTPTSVSTILMSSCLYSFLQTSLRVLLYLGAGVLLFGLKLTITLSGLMAVVVILALTIISFIGIGMTSAAFIIVFKQGSPIAWLVGTASGLLGGVLYPVNVLPGWIEPFSFLLPITHALEAMRQIMLNGVGLAAVNSQAKALTLFALVLFPLGLIAFAYGLRQARKEGSLVHY